MSNTRKIQPPSKPTVISRGRYSIYDTPEGNGVIVFRPDGEKEDQSQVIPSGIWQFILKALRGEAVDLNPMSIVKLMMGGK